MFPFSYSREIKQPYAEIVGVTPSRPAKPEPDMRSITLFCLTLCVIIAASGARPVDGAQAEEIISLERAALDRWGKGDPKGFLEIYAPEITYFDVGTQRRMDGLAAMTEYYRPLVGKVKVPRYEMIGPKVQRHGDVAVLTYNLRSEGILPDGKQVTVRWNSSSVYARIGGQWKVVHSHWSLTAPPSGKGVV
jgi:ketosteroid isomerase-like protein